MSEGQLEEGRLRLTGSYYGEDTVRRAEPGSLPERTCPQPPPNWALSLHQPRGVWVFYASPCAWGSGSHPSAQATHLRKHRGSRSVRGLPYP